MPHRFASPAPVVATTLALFSQWLTGCGAVDFETQGDGQTVGETTDDSSTSQSPTPSAPVVPLPPSTVAPPGPTTGIPPATSEGETSSEGPFGETSMGEATSETTPDPSDTGMTSEAPAPSTTQEPTTMPVDTGEPSDDTPEGEHCAVAADWDPGWAQLEQEVLVLVNEYRAVGANCASQGEFGPADPLEMDPMLRCSARLHSLDMYERDFFDHTNPDGTTFDARIRAAGFSGSFMGENIAYGPPEAEVVMEMWMDSPGHCAGVMNPNFTLIGVGYHPGSGNRREPSNFWTQNFGAPPRQGGGGRGGR